MSKINTGNNKKVTGAAIRVGILFVIIILLNMLASRFHYGLDLTQERRFTLTPATNRLLGNMKDIAVIDVYLEGKGFPAGFQRLQESVRERLQSFRDKSGGRIVYRFTDPFERMGNKEQGAVYRKLAEKGIYGVDIKQNTEEGYSAKIAFPYALVHYKGKEIAINLLENLPGGMSPLGKLNYSENLLEYKFASALSRLSRGDKPRVAYLMGNGEALGMQTFDALSTLGDLYSLDTLDLNSGTQLSTSYSAAIICKPTTLLDDKAKFKLDQYVMRGGHILWLIDPVRASMDSFAMGSQQFIASPYGDAHGLGLDDQLFKYGVRINPDLIEDKSCVRLPLVQRGGDMKFYPWIYFPVFLPTSNHPIVRNMDGIMSAFSSSIDTIANPEVKKTVLLESSQYSRTELTPARVSFSLLNFDPPASIFNKPFRPAAVLLEGKFQSVFQDRLPQPMLTLLRDTLHQPFKAQADTIGSMIVIGDADMFFNDVTQAEGPQPMGYWRLDKSFYANKRFILNCVEYLTDNSGIIEASSKDSRLRLLDTGRAKDESTKWKAVNLIVPVILVLVFASAWLFYRKRKYEGV